MFKEKPAHKPNNNPESQQKAAIEEFSKKYNVPILNYENMDEKLGEEPYATHAIISDSEGLRSILEQGKIMSSKESGKAAMTYESDKLLGMDENVFIALGKGYIKKEGTALVFDPKKLAEIEGVSFVEDDLMNVLGKKNMLENFLDVNKEEIVRLIEENKEKLNQTFKEKVRKYFQGGHGIYGKYFNESGNDRVSDLLKALEEKTFTEIENAKEVIDQFTILRDSILSEEIMTPELRERLKEILRKEVIEPNTVMGKEKIISEIARQWESDKQFYRAFLPEERNVPKKVSEVRIPKELNIKDALVGIYAGKSKKT